MDLTIMDILHRIKKYSNLFSIHVYEIMTMLLCLKENLTLHFPLTNFTPGLSFIFLSIILPNLHEPILMLFGKQGNCGLERVSTWLKVRVTCRGPSNARHNYKASLGPKKGEQDSPLRPSQLWLPAIMNLYCLNISSLGASSLWPQYQEWTS